MQKKIIALAVASAAAGFVSAPVFAQSTVTMYGSIDVGVRNVTNVTADGKSITTLDNKGNYNSNRLGFKDSEDLGNGMNAHFVAEMGFFDGSGYLDNGVNGAAPAGTQVFQRQVFAGLGGAWGNLDLGRQYTVIFKTIGNYDPFNYKYTYDNMIPLAGLDGARHNNDIQYSIGFNGINILAGYSLGQNVGTTQGSSSEIGANYANGPISFGGAFASQTGTPNAVGMTTASTPNLATTGITGLKTKQWTIGGAYAVDPFRIAVGYDDTKYDNVTPLAQQERKVWWLGGSYKVTPAAELSLAYYDTKQQNVGGITTAAGQGDQKFWILGGTYALSKRTNLYAEYDNRKLDGNQVIGGFGAAQTQDVNNGISVGVNHLF